jgi:hypothetical protein
MNWVNPRKENRVQQFILTVGIYLCAIEPVTIEVLTNRLPTGMSGKGSFMTNPLPTLLPVADFMHTMCHKEQMLCLT